jgi:4-amino-4-deoxy-L-arabinose transferase-like glycosyltransferase
VPNLNPPRERAMEKSKSESSFWPVAAAAVAIVIILAAIHWSLGHPFGIHWDEGDYINDIRIDLQRLQTLRLITLNRRILIESYDRPPAYRLLALPFLAPFGFHVTLARLSSLSWFGLSALFIYLATHRIASRAAAAFAVLIFVLSPEVVASSIFFSTDAPVYLATSALLYYLFVSWTDAAPRATTWIGLGLAIGLGFWSKTSFLLIAPPVLAFALFVNFRKHLGLRGLAPLVKAGALGLALAAPWWLLNFRHAMAYAQFARSTVRNSVGPLSPTMLARWGTSVFEGLLGYGIGILIVLLVVFWVVRTILGEKAILDPLRKYAFSACACAGLPLVFAQLSSTNHLLRYLAPTIIPLGIAVGLLADSTEWVTSTAALAVSGTLFCGQLGMFLYPVVFPNTNNIDLGLVNGTPPWRTMMLYEQWDWNQLRGISQACGVETPSISFLGASRTLNPPEIAYPWVAAATSTRLKDLTLPPDPVWLWQYEDGPPNWQKLLDSVQESDLIVTAPHYTGEPGSVDGLDNQYDAEFADRLSRDAHFQGPFHLKMGRFGPVDVVVFAKRTFTCPSANDIHAQR